MSNEQPGHTCPLIDQVISAVRGWGEEYGISRWDLNNVDDLMEKIRDANASLRAWGAEAQQDKEREVAEMEERISRLETEAEMNEDTITNLRRDLAAIERGYTVL